MRASGVGGGLLLSGVLVAGWSPPAVGQIPVGELPGLLADRRFGREVAREYSGTIAWTWDTGYATETAEVGVTQGEVHCQVTYRDPEGTRSVNGPGLIEISLGLAPDEDSPWRHDKMYTIRVACPNAASGSHPEANWSHSQDTYKQPGGAVSADPGTGRAIPPVQLKGSWDVPSEDGGEHTSMTWHLCRTGCTPPSAPPVAP